MLSRARRDELRLKPAVSTLTMMTTKYKKKRGEKVNIELTVTLKYVTLFRLLKNNHHK